MRLPSANDGTGRDFGTEELELLARVIETGALDGVRGVQVRQFEKEFAARHEAPYCRAVHTAAGALVVALAALELEAGDEVVVPGGAEDIVTAVLLSGGVAVSAELDPATRNVSAVGVAKAMTERTRAVVVRHMYGRAAEVDLIQEACAGAAVIEDCGHAPLARRHGRLVGTFGAMGVFSLRQDCHITAGEGGVILTSVPELAERITVILRSEEMPGVQAMTELTAAVARAQLRKLEGSILRRQRTAELLTELLIDIRGLTPAIAEPDSSHVYWKYPLWVNPEMVEGGAAGMVAELRGIGIGCTADGDLLLLDWNEFYTQPHVAYVTARVRQAVERLSRVPVG
jgi:dTDP-4-amino-4,6-dideoxygalactose transaminase